MTNNRDYADVYRSLSPIFDFNETTGLFYDKKGKKVYVVKHEAASAKDTYLKIEELRNPHLSTVLFVADTPRGIDVLQEYVSGQTLEELLDERRVLPQKQAIMILADVCDGLLTMHRAGLIHRDVNPNNIVIGNDGSAVIIDYGIARKYDSEKTTDTTVLGTPGYAAPEQFGFSQSDERTDIYAAGVLFNVMLTGTFPNVKKPQSSLCGIINKCVEIDSKKRYKTIADLNSAVQKLATYNGPADRFIQQIPGLRSKKPAVVILAMIGYILFGILSAAMFDVDDIRKFFGHFLSWLFLFPIPFSCFHNFLGIWDILPFSKKSGKHNQKVLFTALGIISVLIGLIVFSVVNHP